ncbi:MAG: Omp28-related outer membrane protein [Bacteroidetes bacterium]|nr:MAG: Omp28-related outer membrane protein [Bacteroidota bacterium]
MHSKITKFVSTSFVILIAFVISVYSQPVKRVLLEQHTGAWCGWCVDGSYIMDQLLEEYPDQIIGVKVHNGDGMVIPEQATIASTLGLTGYPTGAINRKLLGGKVFQNRTNWKNLCESELSEYPKVDIDMVYTINESTRELTATIRATMLETLNDELRFNLFILEDSCSGTGSQWDQHNYLYHLEGYENNPYYNLPSVIVGYQHMKVVRAMVGGAWGVKGEFTVPAEEGKTYTHTFKFTLDAGWKLKDIYPIGMVAIYTTTSKEILNSTSGTKDGTLLFPNYLLNSESQINKKVVNQGTPYSKVFTLKNESDAAVTYIISANKSQRTPADWSAEVVPPTSINSKDNISVATFEITIEPQETKNIELQLIPGPTRSFGDATLNLEVKNEPSGVKTLRYITAISAETEIFEVISSSESQYSLKNILINLGYNDFLTISPENFGTFIDDFLNKKVIVWNTGVFSPPTSSDISTIFQALNENVPMVLYGNQMVSGLGNDNSLGYFGVSYNGYSTQGFGQPPNKVWLSGVDNDPISGDFGKNTEGNLIQYLITLMKITNWATTHPVLHFSNNGKHVIPKSPKNDTLDISGEDAIFAVRLVSNGNLIFLSSITPFVIKDESKRNTLVDNSIKWVLGMLDVDEEFVTTNIDFSMEVNPNPMESVSMLKYMYKGSHPANLKFVLYNNLGNEVSVINNENLSPGNYQIPLNLGGISSGSYRLAAYIDGKVFSVPVLITR